MSVTTATYVDQYQDLSAPGCTLNWLVKNPGNEPEFLKNSNYLTRFTILLGVAKSTSKGNQSFHLQHCKYASLCLSVFLNLFNLFPILVVSCPGLK